MTALTEFDRMLARVSRSSEHRMRLIAICEARMAEAETIGWPALQRSWAHSLARVKATPAGEPTKIRGAALKATRQRQAAHARATKQAMRTRGLGE